MVRAKRAAPRNEVRNTKNSGSTGALIEQNSAHTFAVITRCREIVAALVDDHGGAENLSEVRLQLLRRFAASTVLAEQMEARLLRGEQVNLAEYISLSATLVRIAKTIGIDRTRSDLAPRLTDYLRSEQVE